MSRDALVVGINIYKYSRLPNLSLPSEDAEAIAQLLTHYGGFRVKRLPEAIEDDNSVCVDPEDTVSLKQLKKAIEQLFLPEGEHPPDTALLYFSGHGLRDDSQIKQGYLATSDVNPDEEKWGLSLKWLRQVLEASPIKRKIIWLDCCYSGELLNFKENLEKETNPGNKEGYNRCFITASRAFEVAFEETSGNHGVLTGALLQGLDPTQQPDGWVTNYSLADFINRELEIQTQRPLCHNSGKAIVLTNNQPKKQLGECPYKGLESFNLKDAHFFYGRTALTDELIKRVEKSNFVAVLGASGSGKSSVLSAGLLYKLKRGEDLLGSDRWQFYPPFNPGEHPLQNLKAAIGKEPDKLEQLIATAQAERVVLIVDQFEECFTLCKDEECQRFLDCLLGAVERTGNKLCLVLGMRADFLDKCTQYPKLADKIESENLAIVKPLDREELEEAIMEPAKKVGLQVEPRLVERMINDVLSSPGRLPLLQDALRELWNEAQKAPDKHLLTLDSYQALEGIEKILEKRANKTYDEELKTDAEQLVAKRVFLELINVGEETEVKVTLKPVHKERLVENVLFGESKEVVNRAIAVLEKARLIVTSDAGVVSIAHQALIDNWKKLRQWVEENPEARRKKRKIQAVAEEWQAKGKSKSYLLQGERLVEAEGFVQSYADSVPLSSLGQEFVTASREESDRLLKEEEERRQRELEQERKARKAAQTRTGVAIASTILVSAAAIVSLFLLRETQRQSVNAQLRAYGTSIEALFASNNGFDALLESLRAARLLKQAQVNPDTRFQVVANLQQAVYSVRERNRLQGHNDEISSVSFSPDGKLIATASKDKTVQLWSRDGIHLKTLKHDSGVISVSFSPDSQTIASLDNYGIVKLWDLNGTLLKTLTGSAITTLSEQEFLENVIVSGGGVSFSPDGQTIASTSGKGIIKLWSRNGTLIETWKADKGRVESISFSPDGQLIASSGWEKTVKLWSREGKLLRILKPEHTSDYTGSVSFSPDSQTVVFAGGEEVTLWSRECKKLATLKDEHHYDYNPPNHSKISINASSILTSVSFSPDGQLIATGTGDKTINLWRRDGVLLETLKGHNAQVNSVSFSPDGKTLASASADKTVKLWGLDDQRPKMLKGHTQSVMSVNFSPDNQTIASASSDNTIKLWNRDGALVKTLKAHGESTFRTEGFWDVSFSSDCQNIAAANWDKTVTLWNRDGTLLKTLQGHPSKFVSKSNIPETTSVSFSPDGQTIASGNVQGGLNLWNFNGTLLKSFAASDGLTTSVVFSPDGKILALAGKFSKSPKRVGRAARARLPTPGDFNSAEFEGEFIVLLTNRDGASTKVLRGHKGIVTSVNFSPNGQLIASASFDKTVKLWKRDGTLLKTLNGYKGLIRDVSFSPDGQQIATAGQDGIYIWNLAGQKLAQFGGTIQYTVGINFNWDKKTKALTVTKVFKDSPAMKAGVKEGDHILAVDGQSPKSVNGDEIDSDLNNKLFSGEVGTKLTLQLSRQGSKNFDVSIIRAKFKAFNSQPLPYMSLSFSPDGQSIVSAGGDNIIKLWSRDGKLLKTWEGHSLFITSVSFSSDSQIIASSSLDKTVKLWNRNGSLLKTLSGHNDKVWKVSFSPDGQTIASASDDKTVKLWTRAGTLLRTLKEYSAYKRFDEAPERIPSLFGVGFSPDSQTIAATGGDGTVQLWSRDGKFIKTFQDKPWSEKTQSRDLTARVFGISFSPNGKTLVSSDSDATAKLWRADGTLLKTLEGHNSAINRVRFSPDGQLIASASNDGTVKLWSSDGKELKALRGHNNRVLDVSFSSDSQIIASASADETIKFWSRDGRELKTLQARQTLHGYQGHQDLIYGVSFSPDGKTLASASRDTTVILWNFDLDNLMVRGCDLVHDYLKNNPDVGESDRHLCDGVGKSSSERQR